MDNSTQRGFASIALIILAVFLVGMVGYFAFVKKSAPIARQMPTPTDKTANWETYTNTRYRFEFKYPKEWLVFERKPKDPDTLLSLQIGPADPADLDKILISSDAAFSPVEIVITSEALESIRERFRKTAEKYNFKAVENQLIFAGNKAFQFANELTDKNDKQYYISFGNNVYIIRTMEYDQENVRHIFSTFRFTK